MPNTFAYWTGTWNGTSFAPDRRHRSGSTTVSTGTPKCPGPTTPDPDNTRYSLAWMNNWRYANEDLPIPSSVSDDISGQMSITRKLQLAARGGGVYTILSTPVAALGDHVSSQFSLPATTLASTFQDLDYHGTAYELETDISWTSVQNVGISVGRSADGSRYTNLGIYQNQEFYTDRRESEIVGQNPDISFKGWNHTDSPFSTSARTVHLRVFVDKGSIEVFIDDGAAVHSSQVYFSPGEDGIRFYTDGGSATFSNIVIREFEDITTAADPATPLRDVRGRELRKLVHDGYRVRVGTRGRHAAVAADRVRVRRQQAGQQLPVGGLDHGRAVVAQLHDRRPVSSTSSSGAGITQRPAGSSLISRAPASVRDGAPPEASTDQAPSSAALDRESRVESGRHVRGRR